MAFLVFILSAAFVVYVLFGYPLWLGLRARVRQKPVRARPVTPSVSILLPVRNGEPWMRQKLECILRLDYPRQRVETLVICDGCTDRTEQIVREFAPFGIELVSIPSGGKAAALNKGIGVARGEVLFFTDVRQELEPSCLRLLVESLADPSVGAASGELVILEGGSRQEADVGLYWRYEKWIRARQSRLDSILGATGCIYAMRRELAVAMPSNTLLDDVYLPLAAFFRGYRVILEENAKAFDSPTSLDAEFYRKVRTQAGVYQVMRSYPALLRPSTRMWIHFVSHKLGRLLLPFALTALFVSAFGLAAPWRQIALSLQTVFYALAALDLIIPEAWIVKRLSSPIRTFVVLVAAALCAASILVRPGRNFWKETRVNSAKPLS